MEKVKQAVCSASGRVVGVVGGAGAFLAMSATNAFAAAQNYSSIGSGATDEITAIIPVALGVLALGIGIPIAVGIFRKIAH